MAPLWAKLSIDILGDPKLMRAARKGARGIEFLPWLIAWAKRADDEGRLTVNSEAAELADYCEQIPGSTPHRIGAALFSLVEIGVLEDAGEGVLRLSQWDTRQSETRRPSDSPDRVRERVTRHRNAKRNDVTETTESKRETKSKRGEEETPPVSKQNGNGPDLLEAGEVVNKIRALRQSIPGSVGSFIRLEDVRAMGGDFERVYKACQGASGFLVEDAKELSILTSRVAKMLYSARQSA